MRGRSSGTQDPPAAGQRLRGEGAGGRRLAQRAARTPHVPAARAARLPSSSRARDAADSTAALTALEKMLAEEESRPSFAQQIVEDTPAHAREMALRSAQPLRAGAGALVDRGQARLSDRRLARARGDLGRSARCCRCRRRRLPIRERGEGRATAAGVGACPAGGLGPATHRAQRGSQPAGQRLGPDVVGGAAHGVRECIVLFSAVQKWVRRTGTYIYIARVSPSAPRVYIYRLSRVDI